MKVWERHSLIVLPFVVLATGVRRAAEAARLMYWKRVFGWQIGRGVRVHWSVHISKGFKVRLGDGVVIQRWVQFNTDTGTGIIEIGPNTSIAQSCQLDISGALRIGSNVTLSEGVFVYTHSHGRNPRNKPVGHEVVIEDDVWLCARSTVLASAQRVGKGAIVGPHKVLREPLTASEMFV